MKSIRNYRLLRSAVPLALAVVWISSDASGQSEAECCLRGTSTALTTINGTGTDADEKFFVVKGAPPNLMFLLDSSGSMMDFPIPNYEAAPYDSGGARSNAGCTNPTYDAVIAAAAFDLSKSYPPIDLGVDPAAWNGDVGYPDLFRETAFYADKAPEACCGGDWWVDNATHYTVADACALTSDPTACNTCVTTKGYWLDPVDIDTDNDGDSNDDAVKRADVFHGKFMNFYPPKYHIARTVIKELIWDVKDVRMGLTILNDRSGGKLIAKPNPPCDKSLDPEDASWTNNRKNIINSINNKSTVSFGGSTPVAEALLDVGQLFTSDQATWEGWFGPGWYDSNFKAGDIGSEDRSVCYGCQVTSTVLISDGLPTFDNCVPQCIKNQGATCVGCDDTWSSCGSNSSGDCPAQCGTGADCKAAGTSGCCQTDGKMALDDVAKWFWEKDLQTKSPGNKKWDASGRQRMSTYAVGFGLDHPLLRNTAAVGGGEYYTANDKNTLETQLRAVISSVNQRATAFGVSSISTLQTSSGLSTLVPRFVPGKPGQQWTGFLYRFGLENEQVNGCVAGTPSDPKDINSDGDCNDLFYMDRDEDIVIEEPVTGLFIKQGTTQEAKPLWEAGWALKYDNPTYSGYPTTESSPRLNPDTRNIWTVTDDPGATDNRIDRKDPLVAFTKANAAKLMGWMGISQDISGDESCKTILVSMGYDVTLPPPVGEPSNWGQKCAEVVIEWFRGKKSTNPDPVRRNEPRDWLLGDIFHSSPVLVEPPIQQEACFFYPSQCVASVFAYGGGLDSDASAAYRDYVTASGGVCGSEACERRRALVLVGSNGGFLHAFDGGDPLSPEDRDVFTQRLKFSPGSGREIWAFVPPDLLGKMKFAIASGRHAYFVDGAPMVRDVWVDHPELNQGDGVKAAGEFRTVAVVGERSGGQHFFALDVTENMRGASTPKPKFLWMWPQPCDTIAADVGESWSNFFPKPPPIVPILLDANTTGYPNPFTLDYRKYDPSTNKWSNAQTQAQERWVVALNGGYDRAYVRGRGFALVDVYTGKTLWKQFFDENGTDLQKLLRYPISAGVAMLDIGPGETRTTSFFDGYFDSFTVGDLGGNYWVARMYEPGRLVGGEVSNWSFARAFQTRLADGESMLNRRPISYISSNALQPSTGYLRSFFGTGDRNSLLQKNGGVCSLDNLDTCIQMGCKVESKYEARNIPSGENKFESKWDDWVMNDSKRESQGCVDSTCFDNLDDVCDANCTKTSCSGSAPCGTCAGKDACLAYLRSTACAAPCTTVCKENELKVDVHVSECPTTTVGPVSSMDREAKVTCKQGSSTLVECKLTTDKNSVAEIVYKSNSIPSHRHRFFGVHVFGSEFADGTAKTFHDPATALAFDARRLSEANLADLGTLSAPSGTLGTVTGPGWFLRYDSIDERTASPAGLLFSQNLDSGCVIWNSLTPTVSSTVCAASGNQIANLIQADYITGGSNCALGFKGQRFISRNVIAPPPEPSPVVMLKGGGKSVSYALITAEPGNEPEVTETAVNNELIQSVFQLELDKTEHACRHTTGGAACAP